MKPIAFLLALIVGAGPLAAAPDLFSLTGTWRGSGLIRPAPDRPLREGRCRITATPVEPGRVLELAGRCATDQGAASLTMRLEARAGGVIAAGVATSASPDTVQFLGRATPDGARLSSRAPVEVDGLRADVELELRLTPGPVLNLSQQLLPVDERPPFAVLQMEFTRLPEAAKAP